MVHSKLLIKVIKKATVSAFTVENVAYKKGTFEDKGSSSEDALYKEIIEENVAINSKKTAGSSKAGKISIKNKGIKSA